VVNSGESIWDITSGNPPDTINTLVVKCAQLVVPYVNTTTLTHRRSPPVGGTLDLASARYAGLSNATQRWRSSMYLAAAQTWQNAIAVQDSSTSRSRCASARWMARRRVARLTAPTVVVRQLLGVAHSDRPRLRRSSSTSTTTTPSWCRRMTRSFPRQNTPVPTAARPSPTNLWPLGRSTRISCPNSSTLHPRTWTCRRRQRQGHHVQYRGVCTQGCICDHRHVRTWLTVRDPGHTVFGTWLTPGSVTCVCQHRHVRIRLIADSSETDATTLWQGKSRPSVFSSS